MTVTITTYLVLVVFEISAFSELYVRTNISMSCIGQIKVPCHRSALYNCLSLINDHGYHVHAFKLSTRIVSRYIFTALHVSGRYSAMFRTRPDILIKI